MKIFKILLVTAIAFGMMACNNEDEIDLQGQPESTVSVKVVPSSNGPVVRATGDLSDNGVLAAGLPAESAIKSLEVYLFYGEKPEGYGEATGDNVTEVKEIATHAGPKTIVVVANSKIGPVTTKTALMEATMNLPVAIASGLPMNGESAEIILEPGLNQYGYPESTGAKQFSVGTPLPLYRVNARVAIVSAKLADNLTDDQTDFFDGLEDVQVAMFNVPETTKLFGEELVTNANFLFGDDWPTTAGTYTVGTPEESFKDDDVTFPITVGDAPYYYVNENSSEEDNEQMMIVLRAKPTKDGQPAAATNLYTDADGYTYYPIWVNAGDLGYTFTGHNSGGDNIIRRNTQYNISLTINGIGNPTIDPVEEAFLDVNVSVEDWTVVNQNVTWGTSVVEP